MSRASLGVPTPRGPRASTKFKNALGNLQRYARSTSKARTIANPALRRSPRLRAKRLAESGGMAASDSEYDDCGEDLNDGRHDHKHDDDDDEGTAVGSSQRRPPPRPRFGGSSALSRSSMVDTDADTLNDTNLSLGDRSVHGYSFDEGQDIDGSYVDVGDDRDDMKLDPNWRRNLNQDSSAVGASSSSSSSATPRRKPAAGAGLSSSYGTPWTGRYGGGQETPRHDRTPSSRSLSRSPSRSHSRSPRTIASILNSSNASRTGNASSSRRGRRSHSRSPLPPLPSPSPSHSRYSHQSRSRSRSPPPPFPAPAEPEEVFEERAPSFLERTRQYFRRVKPREEPSFIDDTDPGDAEIFRDLHDDTDDDYFYTRHRRSMTSVMNASVVFAQERVHNLTMMLQEAPRKSAVVFGFGVLFFVLAVFAWHSHLSAIMSGGGGGLSWFERIQMPQPIVNPIYPRDVQEQVIPLIQEACANNTLETQEKLNAMDSKADKNARRLEELSAHFSSLVEVVERNHSDLVRQQEKMDSEMHTKLDDLRVRQEKLDTDIQSKLGKADFVTKIDELSSNLQQSFANAFAEQLKGFQQPQAPENSQINQEWTDRINELEAKLESRLESASPSQQRSEEEGHLREIIANLESRIQKVESGDQAPQIVDASPLKQLEDRLDEHVKSVQKRSDSLPSNYASKERGAKVIDFSELFYPQRFFLQPLYDYTPVLGGYLWRRTTVDEKKAHMVISPGWNCARFKQLPAGVFMEVALTDVTRLRSLTLAGRAPDKAAGASSSGSSVHDGSLQAELAAQPHMFSVLGRLSARNDNAFDTLLDHAYYDRDGEVYQTFQLDNIHDRAYDVVKIVVHENYGHETFTSLYRVMVHGDPWP